MAWRRRLVACLVMCVGLVVGVRRAEATTVMLSSDRAAPQAVGTMVRWTASGAGGTAPYSYKWWLYDGASWKMLRDWNASTTYDWTPAVANSGYRIGVWVRSANKTADVDEANEGAYFAIVPAPAVVKASAVTLSSDRAAPQVIGTTVTFTAQATGGTAPLSYKWWLWDGASWRALRDWNTDPRYAWTPVAANAAYRIGVWVRSAGNALDADETNNSMYFAISDASSSTSPPAAPPASPNPSSTATVTALTVAADRVAPQAPGTTITLTATPTGGVAPQSYKWWLYNGSSWTLLRDWSTSASLAWTPSTENVNYKLGVWVRSAGNTSDVDESNISLTFPVTTSRKVAVVSLSADRPAPQPPGTSVTFTATPTGGVAPQSYKWWLYDGTSWSLLRDWSTSASLTWTPSVVNSAYKLGVWARSAGNTTDVDESNVSLAFSIAAAKVAAVNLTADRAAPQPAGTAVRWTAVASGGVAPASYKWWVYDGLQWTALSGWTTENQIVWTPSAPNEAFKIGVWARSATSTADVDEANMSQAFPVRGGVPDCLDTIEPQVVTLGSAGGLAAVAVSVANTGCAWTATSQASWITVTAGKSGSSSGTVSLAIAPNVDKVSRIGFVMIGPRAVSITQGGVATSDGCTYAVFPTTINAGFENDIATVAVTAPNGCAWGVSSNGFVTVHGSGGVGSGTLTLEIENNTARETRATVLTIAGRAVTVTQAGVSANPQGCSYSVSPSEVSLDFRAGNGTVTVSTGATCSWTASSSSSFAHLNGAASGTGSGVVSYVVDANGSSSGRSGLLMVAGKPVTLSQQGTSGSSAPACAVSLSSSSAEVSYAGGSGAVGVSTAAGCAWSVVSHTSWLHVTESSGSGGNGNVWYSVEANAGSPRAGTLVIGGQTFTISQGEPPRNANVDEITWTSQPDPERVGQCEGNCGAGCGTFFNPCGGPHYWEHTVVTTPQYTGDDWEPVCTSTSSWFVVTPRYTAVTRWTYHGLKSSKCEEHDATCRNLNLLPYVPADKVLCLATAGLVGLNGFNYCEGAQPFDWSYDVVDVGRGKPVAYVDGADSSCR